MKNLEITEKNKNTYKKLLDIKEGKKIANHKSFIIPVILMGIEGFIAAYFTMFNPFFSSNMMLKLLAILIYSPCIFGIIHINVKLSDKMGLYYFEKKYPEINTTISIRELKNKLKEYEEIDKTKDKDENNKQNKNINCIDSNVKIQSLRNEKSFWIQYQKTNEDKPKEKVLKK